MFAAVRQAQAAFGIATDGDADRIAACDETGAYIYPHELIALLTEHLAECGERGAVVCNLATGDIVASVAAYHGLLYISTPVGFKHIVAQMLAREVLIGGEESGGISVARYLKERDAVVCAILLREHLRRRGVSMSRALAELYRRHGYSVYRRFDEHLDVTTMTRLTDRLRTAPPDRIGDARVAALDFTDGVKFRFGPRRWLLVRPSGTEPLVRIYAEDESEVAALARIAAFRNWMSRP
jgi:phosphomannomutase